MTTIWSNASSVGLALPFFSLIHMLPTLWTSITDKLLLVGFLRLLCAQLFDKLSLKPYRGD